MSRTAGYQTWSNLLFLHWRVQPDHLQNALPDGLTVETFDGAGWIALVPFSMQRVRPWWSPPVPGISWFLETNVRTYVKHRNGDTGVWFFSLDANHRLACWVARTFWNLNYVDAKLAAEFPSGDAKPVEYRYSGSRLRDLGQKYQIAATVDKAVPLQSSTEGTLDHFLLERYRLFARRPNGSFLQGDVHHDPYRFRKVDHCTVSENLIAAAGCNVTGPPDHVAFSPGVDVRVSPIEPVSE